MNVDSLRVALIGAAVVAVIFMALHERHYRNRDELLGDAELAGLRLEVDAIKRILREDRQT